MILSHSFIHVFHSGLQPEKAYLGFNLPEWQQMKSRRLSIEVFSEENGKKLSLGKEQKSPDQTLDFTEIFMEGKLAFVSDSVSHSSLMVK